MPAVHLLLATIPKRKDSCERLLRDIAKQSRVPDQIELVLDGYGSSPAPVVPAQFAVREWRTPKPSGPGGRWRVAEALDPDATIVVIDDDICIGKQPSLVADLTSRVEQGKFAAAASGTTFSGNRISWPFKLLDTSYLAHLHSGTCAMAAGDLAGLQQMRAEVVERFKFDPFGDLGDDESMVSICLTRNGVKIRKIQAPKLYLDQNVQYGIAQSLRRDHANFERHAEAFRKCFNWVRPCR